MWVKCRACGRVVLREKRVPVAGEAYCSWSCSKRPRSEATAAGQDANRRARAQERRLAEALDGRVVRVSGALPGSGGDVRTSRWLVEAKTTRARQYTLRAATWEKVVVEASRAGRKPLLALHVGEYDLVVMDEVDFRQLCEGGES